MATRPPRKSHAAPETVPRHRQHFVRPPGEKTLPPIYSGSTVRTPSISSGRRVPTSPDVFGQVNRAYPPPPLPPETLTQVPRGLRTSESARAASVS